jgi:hypothetical protein
MAAPETLRFGQFLIELESTDSPNTYRAPCGLTSKGFSRKAQTGDTVVPV